MFESEMDFVMSNPHLAYAIMNFNIGTTVINPVDCAAEIHHALQAHGFLISSDGEIWSWDEISREIDAKSFVGEQFITALDHVSGVNTEFGSENYSMFIHTGIENAEIYNGIGMTFVASDWMDFW